MKWLHKVLSILDGIRRWCLVECAPCLEVAYKSVTPSGDVHGGITAQTFVSNCVCIDFSFSRRVVGKDSGMLNCVCRPRSDRECRGAEERTHRVNGQTASESEWESVIS